MITHELGHCLGQWHEQNRSDWDAWLLETSIGADHEVRGDAVMPRLGNYDYDSIMHYGSRNNEDKLKWQDRKRREFSRISTDQRTRTDSLVDTISAHDRSRLLQYYARHEQPKWGFFVSLNKTSRDRNLLPNPYLDADVRPIGSPAIAH